MQNAKVSILCRLNLHSMNFHGQIYPLLFTGDSEQRICHRCGFWKIDWGNGVTETGKADEGHTWGTRQGTRDSRFPKDPDWEVRHNPRAGAMGVSMDFTTRRVSFYGQGGERPFRNMGEGTGASVSDPPIYPPES